MRRLGKLGPAAACLLGLLTTGVSVGPAQPMQEDGRAPGARSAAVLSPDTVRVGDPFTLGLSVSGPREAEVEFPPLLQLIPELEQLRPVEVEWDDAGGGRWTARYPLVAWKAGRWSIPDVVVGSRGAELSLAPPTVHVTSVLPAASAGPQPLEGPRGPKPIRGFPWWLLLLLLAALLLWWLLRRLRRVEQVEEVEWIDPADAAREALAGLKRGFEAGEVDLAAFYDGLERVLRTYLSAHRGWPAARPVREFVEEAVVDARLGTVEAGLRSLQTRAGLVRFAHLDAVEAAALADADACLAWLDAEEELAA